MEESAERLVKALNRLGLKLSLAESCTGGLLAAAITDVPGSSNCFDRAYITYSDISKHEMIGVPYEVLEEFGAVSAKTALLMADGARDASNAGIVCSVTGVAGPGPDLSGNQAGTVFIACAVAGMETQVRSYSFDGGRADVRRAAVRAALNFLLERMNEEGLL
jgi:nicotinamide-nucleotide amidase